MRNHVSRASLEQQLPQQLPQQQQQLKNCSQVPQCRSNSSTTPQRQQQATTTATATTGAEPFTTTATAPFDDGSGSLQITPSSGPISRWQRISSNHSFERLHLTTATDLFKLSHSTRADPFDDGSGSPQITSSSGTISRWQRISSNHSTIVVYPCKLLYFYRRARRELKVMRM